MSAIIELKDLTKTYQNGDVETLVLRGLNLTIESGEFVALMGPSGSGKSTLMHILSFLDRPTSGAYIYRDRDVTALTNDERATLRLSDIGFVFQAFHLLPKLTVLENVMLPLVYAGLPAADRKHQAAEALNRVGLNERLDYLPNQLSGGQKQRVAIARALINNPSVIFADEPTGNLDSVSSEQVLNILADLHNEGRTIVMVTHETEAASFAKRVIRMKDGVVIG
ncbi:MAG: ABC transporter ATP-binding protein [Patescibacteria group bacterium]